MNTNSNNLTKEQIGIHNVYDLPLANRDSIFVLENFNKEEIQLIMDNKTYIEKTSGIFNFNSYGEGLFIFQSIIFFIFISSLLIAFSLSYTFGIVLFIILFFIIIYLLDETIKEMEKDYKVRYKCFEESLDAYNFFNKYL